MQLRLFERSKRLHVDECIDGVQFVEQLPVVRFLVVEQKPTQSIDVLATLCSAWNGLTRSVLIVVAVIVGLFGAQHVTIASVECGFTRCKILLLEHRPCLINTVVVVI